MIFRTIAAGLICYLATCSASFGAVIYQDLDPGVGPGQPTPNSDAAAAAFDSAVAGLGPVQLIDFENLSTGNFTTRTIASGVGAQLINTATSSGIRSDTGDSIIGYNTTLGGSRYLRVAPGGTASGVRFIFSEPIHAFGAYITGLGTANGDLTAQFVDGSLVVLPIVGADDGGAQFYGFTNAGVPLSYVLLRFQGSAGDVFSVDDVRLVGVPEPSTGLLAALGIACLAAIRLPRGRRKPGPHTTA